MKIVSNTKLINRNKKISTYTTIASLVFLGLGFYLTLRDDPASMFYSLIALFLGITVWQISVYFTNRWGAKVCPYELIASALKGLEDKYTLYHFSTPVNHLLAGPTGLWVVVPILSGGRVSYTNGRWNQKGVNAFFKFFSQDKLGRPDVEAQIEITDLMRAMKKQAIQIDPALIKPVAMFFNPKVELSTEDAPILCLASGKVKDYLRKLPKSQVVPPELLQSLRRIVTIKDIKPS
jgi:hypothetical protein